MVFFTLLLMSVVFCFLWACIMFCSPLWWFAYCPSGFHCSLFRFFRPALEPVTRGFGFCCSNMRPRSGAVSVLAVHCCMTKQHKTLWLKIIIYLLLFLGGFELSGLWWVLFTGSPHAASLRLRWASPESSGAGALRWLASTLAGDLAVQLGLLNSAPGHAWASCGMGSGFWAGASQEQWLQEAGHGCEQPR